ncbi:MAG: helix-turn-helix domain-containing protein [Opitutales bacterium]
MTLFAKTNELRFVKEIISFGHLRIGDLGLHKNRGLELTYITRGRMEWVVDGRVEVVRQGDVFFTLPWQLHGSPVLQQPENEAWHLLFRLPGDFTAPRRRLRFPRVLGFAHGEEQRLSRTLLAARRHRWPASSRLRMLFPWAVEELERPHALSRANAKSLLRLLMTELIRIMEEAPEGREKRKDSDGRVLCFLEELKERAAEEWSLDGMARACGMRRTHFSNLVHRETGVSPMTYLARVRVDRARDLLRDNRHSVTEVAMACGFGSSQYFANVFRRQTGMSPSEYRTHYPDLYQLEVDPEQVPWRTLKEERERVERFRLPPRQGF